MTCSFHGRKPLHRWPSVFRGRTCPRARQRPCLPIVWSGPPVRRWRRSYGRVAIVGRPNDAQTGATRPYASAVAVSGVWCRLALSAGAARHVGRVSRENVSPADPPRQSVERGIRSATPAQRQRAGRPRGEVSGVDGSQGSAGARTRQFHDQRGRGNGSGCGVRCARIDHSRPLGCDLSQVRRRWQVPAARLGRRSVGPPVPARGAITNTTKPWHYRRAGGYRCAAARWRA